jgi:hypothetical protein
VAGASSQNIFHKDLKKQNLKKIQIAVMAVALVMAAQARATLYDITFTGSDGKGAVTGSGQIDVVGGYADGGYFNITSGDFFSGLTYGLNYGPGGGANITDANITGTGGLNLNGDNGVNPAGPTYIDSVGLLFDNTGNVGNVNPYHGDVLNLWGNSPGSYTLYGAGPDFPSGAGDQLQANGDVTMSVAPVPEPTTIIAGVSMLLPLGASALRSLRKKQMA